ncbi:hypothetical protein TVAG_384620 [Trichomonas vaginalis G3]|uniref:Uncharacterized protein n=1 Tax=Trichomonas vaginalis (strain ATCC PRA-98 / G3) TaxID=412133 RepID=A2FUD0_TRIV3|nr:hypothetical protein TVAGG3_0534510 [Trichomonas vaginalis G3]EAX91482.1 hypothetical protein TVAG_384620 [Trichomonas vaginalis G3]KAI5519392.1 hypothetical protein TVAGG3_0534510 [Trichomonas vaginalis G3]|eukprot:XP_001304412.1 hypothetical protein [Trichomonas vaginalis G3]
MKQSQSGSSLFSINVQDDIIQDLFKHMKDEIDSLKYRVSYLTDELNSRPSVEDFRKLSQAVKELQDTNKTYENYMTQTIDSAKTELGKMIEGGKKDVKSQMEETTLSINQVIRAQNTLMDKKVFDMTRPTFEFNEMKRSVTVINEQNAVIEKKLDKIFTWIAGFINEAFPDNGRCRITLEKIFESHILPINNRIDELETKINDGLTRIGKLETTFYRISDLTKAQLPTYESVKKVPFSSHPKLPKLTKVRSFTDYFNYLMQVVPTAQMIFKLFYEEVEILKKAVGESTIEELERKREQEENEMANFVKYEELEGVKQQLSQMQFSAINKDDLKVVQEDIRNIRDTTINKDEFEATVDRMNFNINKVDQKASEGIQKLELSLVEAKMNIPSSPAYTEVKPKGQTSFKIIFGDSNNGNVTSRSVMSRKSEDPRVMLPGIQQKRPVTGILSSRSSQSMKNPH